MDGLEAQNVEVGGTFLLVPPPGTDSPTRWDYPLPGTYKGATR